MRLLSQRPGKTWLGAASVAVVVLVLGVFWIARGKPPEADAQEHQDGKETEAVAVKVCKAQPGGLERATTQPGTVRAFQYEGLYPKVSGFLVISEQMDLGSKVKKGQVLAEIYAPELLKDKEHAE